MVTSTLKPVFTFFQITKNTGFKMCPYILDSFFESSNLKNLILAFNTSAI